MWDWVNCHLMRRHNDTIWCENRTVYLKCTRCGRRSSGWKMNEPLVFERQGTARPATRPEMHLVSGSAAR